MLPLISLGAWETFGGYRGAPVAKECLFRAFDLGITHFDFANNYGRPPGNAERVCGRILKELPRDEIIVSSKAGFHMWPGPYGEWGSRKHVVASCEQSLKRLGVDYLDVFYSHRFDPGTPLDETLGALDFLVKQGKALYVGVSNYDGAAFAEAVRVCSSRGLAPLTMHQSRYNLLERGMERDVAPLAGQHGVGLIAYSPLASGILSSKYLGDAPPKDSRAAEIGGGEGGAFLAERLTRDRLAALKGLRALAGKRGQTLAQMALAWALRLPGVASVLTGASRASQIEENVAALGALEFSGEELEAMDRLCPVR